MNKLSVYTDGACSGNPGPAGIGVLLYYKGSRKEISNYIGEATNNIAELTAIKVGLSCLTKFDLRTTVYTDSKYCIGMLAGNWKGTKNLELIAEIKEILTKFSDLRFQWIKGHSGNHGNEVADRLATNAIERIKNK